MQWSATDSAHSLQQQDQLRSRVVAADQLATSNDQLTTTNQQLTAANQQLTASYEQLTAANDQLTASNHQLTISSGQLETEISSLRERLGASEAQLEELRRLVEERQLASDAGQEAKLAAVEGEAEQLRHQLAAMVSNLDAASVTIGQLQAEVEQHQKSNEALAVIGGEGNFQQAISSSTSAVESSTTSTNLFSQEGSTAALFGGEPSSTASLFPVEPSSTASLFSQEESRNNTAALFQEQPSSNTTASLFSQEETTTVAQGLVSSTEPQAQVPDGSEVPGTSSAEVTWYQEQLVSYQQAVHEWQLWGEQQAGEIEQLKQQLEHQTGEMEQLRQQLQQQGMQDQVTMKQLEVQDLRETVERLESEKEELIEEIQEMRVTIDDLRNLNDSAQQSLGSADDSVQLEDLRNSLEVAEQEKSKLLKEMQEQRALNEKLTDELRENLQQKEVEMDGLGKKIKGYTEQVKELEESLAEEKKAQEEVADEFEAMQLQVQESGARVNELLAQLEAAQKIAEEVKTESEQTIEKAEVAEEAKVVENAAIVEGAAVSNEELAQYQQSLADWAVWAETKTEEYNVLLEAYNQYVEAYKLLQTELETAKAGQQVEDSKIADEVTLLKKEMEEKEIERQEKEVAWVEMVEELREKKEEIACLKPAVEALEAEKQEKELVYVELSEELREKKERIACLEPALEAYELKQKEGTALENQTQTLEAEIEKKSALLLTFEAEKVKALQEVEEVQEKLLEKEKEILEVKNSSSALEAQLEEVQGKLSEKERELAVVQAESSSMSAAGAELEQYKAALQEWSLWAEARTTEIAALQQERDLLLQQVQEKEAELVEKSGSIARMSIQSALTARTVPTPAPAEDSFEAALGAQQEKLRQERERQETEERVEVLQEKLSAAETRTGQMAAALEQAQEALARSLQEKRQVEERLLATQATGEGKEDTKEEVKMQETAPGWGESDEGWGVEQSELQGDASTNQEDLLALETEISQLREKIRSVEADKAKLQEELNAAKLKNGKMLVKVKTLTKEVETLKKKKPSPSGFDDLDRAMEDELKSQAEKALKEAAEARKEIEVVKQEKEALLKKSETLEAGNLRMVEMKEKQDFEMEFLTTKNKELDSQVSGLQWSLAEVEERREEEVNELTSKLAVLTSTGDTEEMDSAAIRLQVLNQFENKIVF